VTAIVLLTGREPANLFDQTRSTWNWQQWVRIDPKFAQVLQRMLSQVPRERYQTASEVLQALSAIDLDDPKVLPISSNSESIVPVRSASSVLDNPLAIGAIGVMVIILAGCGSWALVNFWRNQTKHVEEKHLPQTFPSPIIAGGTPFHSTATSASIPQPTETKTSALMIRRKPLRLVASHPLVVSNLLKENQVIRYSFMGKAGQDLTVYVDQGLGILLTVFNSNHTALDNQSPQVASFVTTLPNNGKYIIQLGLAPKVAESEYSLSITLGDPLKFKSTPRVIHHLPKSAPTTSSTTSPQTSPQTRETPTINPVQPSSNPEIETTPTPPSGL
jgi:hypothetical protein